MEKLLVRWSDGRSKGTTSLVKRSTIKKGTIAVGEKVVVVWGKTKRTFNAEIVDVNGGVRSAENARQDASNREPFVFELTAPASPTQAMNLPSATPTPVLQVQQEDRIVAALVDKLDVLVDAVSRVEARLCRLQTLEEEVTALKEEVRERCIHPQSSELQPNIIPEPEPQSLEEEPSLPVLQPCIPPAPYPSLEYPPLPPSLQPCFPTAPLLPQEMSTLGPMPYWHARDNCPDTQMAPIVLQDVSTRANMATPPVGCYTISNDVMTLALQSCRSRRNLAGRLAARVFTMREKMSSNCRGKQGKSPLDQGKLLTIFTVCMQHFPLQRLETQQSADKDMRNAVDEVCRKTRTIAAAEPENVTYT